MTTFQWKENLFYNCNACIETVYFAFIWVLLYWLFMTNDVISYFARVMIVFKEALMPNENGLLGFENVL